MCGRYSEITEIKALQKRFGFKESHLTLKSRYNLAPSQPAPVVVDEGQKTLRSMKWGLMPFWAKEDFKPLINARLETLAQKPSFRKSFKKQRCLVLADGYYEWRQVPGQKNKTPMRITLKSGEPFGFAGIWDLWGKKNMDGIRTFAIITLEAKGAAKTVHNRMPAILRPEDEDAWLDPKFQDTNQLEKLIKSGPYEELGTYEISPLINSPANDTPEVIEKVHALI